MHNHPDAFSRRIVTAAEMAYLSYVTNNGMLTDRGHEALSEVADPVTVDAIYRLDHAQLLLVLGRLGVAAPAMFGDNKLIEDRMREAVLHECVTPRWSDLTAKARASWCAAASTLVAP